MVGTTRDTAGAPLAVEVSAKSPALIEPQRVTLSDAKGRYRILVLPEGSYTLTFLARRHFPVTLENVMVRAGEQTEVADVVLKPGMEEIVGTTHPGAWRRDAIDSLPPCVGERSDGVGDWQRVGIEGFALLVPPATAIRSVSDWSGDVAYSVSLVRGYFGPFTFDAYDGLRCRGEVNGHAALVSEGLLGTGQTYVIVWVPTLRLPGSEPYEAFVVARAPGQEDLPVLRSIASSLRVTP